MNVLFGILLLFFFQGEHPASMAPIWSKADSRQIGEYRRIVTYESSEGHLVCNEFEHIHSERANTSSFIPRPEDGIDSSVSCVLVPR
jgi:hypothetical protein